MGRAVTNDQVARIEALRHKRSGREIAKLVGVSPATVSQVLAGKQAIVSKRKPLPVKRAPRVQTPSAAQAAADPVGAIGVPDTVPDGTELGQARRWLAELQRAADNALIDDNLTAYASLTAKFTALLEYIRKATPTPREDPNEHPDMIALGDEVWIRLKKAFGFVE